MKKLICIALAALLLVGLTACGEKTEIQKAPEGTPGELIDKIYENHKALQLNVFTMDLDLNDPDAVRYNLGLEAADKLSAAAISEAMMGQAYSLVVLRVKALPSVSVALLPLLLPMTLSSSLTVCL